MSDIYDLRLPKPMAEVLTKMVTMAEENQALAMTFELSRNGNFYAVNAGKGPADIPELKREQLLMLQALGFVSILEEPDPRLLKTGTLFWEEKTYSWVHHHRRGRVGRWWERAKSSGRETAPLIVSIAAVILTILQILQALRLL